MASEELAPLTEDEIRSLIDKSKEAKEYAYAPYSRFPVGAALLAKDGRTFTGKLDSHRMQYSRCVVEARRRSSSYCIFITTAAV